MPSTNVLFKVALSAWLLIASRALALSGGALDTEQHHAGVLTIRADPLLVCSAVKIGARTLLTAAHCVVDERSGELKSAFRTGAEILVDNATQQADHESASRVIVDETRLPEAYREGLAKFADYRRRRLAELKSQSSALPIEQLEQGLSMRYHFAERYPDLALIQLRTTTPEIPHYQLDFTPLEAGAEVELVGFGCSRLGDRLSAERRSGWSRVIRVDAVNFYTEAGQRVTQAPSLCPGDSGGPVLYQGRVVGVHAVVYGLHARHGARSNMAVNLVPLADWQAWP
ncbi:MAG: trypsin-like serine protease [Lamprobacter sp.]|uniref:trypsin-like serine peptidase n=1 Tax=Lamprobacter sp. TaxID=3100796 RepID=UPI002B260D64|nr:trypsin-like serine protease [Lamprobacter sp.]MEA3638446.1 trypsin-like serine protease [Lamprobacter sp.]